MRAAYAELERAVIELIDAAIERAQTQWERDRLADVRAGFIGRMAALDEPRWAPVSPEAAA